MGRAPSGEASGGRAPSRTAPGPLARIWQDTRGVPGRRTQGRRIDAAPARRGRHRAVVVQARPRPRVRVGADASVVGWRRGRGLGQRRERIAHRLVPAEPEPAVSLSHQYVLPPSAVRERLLRPDLCGFAVHAHLRPRGRVVARDSQATPSGRRGVRHDPRRAHAARPRPESAPAVGPAPAERAGGATILAFVLRDVHAETRLRRARVLHGWVRS